MGHAGAFTLPGEPDALTKIKAFENVGVTMVNHPAKFGNAMKALLGNSGQLSNSLTANSASQKRGMHTTRVRPTPRSSIIDMTQKRTIYIKEEDAFRLLDEKKIDRTQMGSNEPREPTIIRQFTIGIDRSNRCPCITVKRIGNGSHVQSSKLPFSYKSSRIQSSIFDKCVKMTKLQRQRAYLRSMLDGLFELFKEKEAFLLETIVNRYNNVREPLVESAKFGFDDAAFKSANRQSEIHSLPRADVQDPAEAEAEKHGIVYIKLAGDGNIGTLVNGAGLAMNTVDALADAGGKAANFLDTGGKATAETVKRGFEAILKDERVKVVFVNIFGGLTLGDMIAEGILLAFRELGVKIPVVVRIRGTNEKEGQSIIAESGLPLYAYDDFDEAAAKVIELANSSES